MELLNLDFFTLPECPGYEEIIRDYLAIVDKTLRRRGGHIDQGSVEGLQNIFLSGVVARLQCNEARSVIMRRTSETLIVSFDLFNSLPLHCGYNAFMVLRAIARKHLPTDEMPEIYR